MYTFNVLHARVPFSAVVAVYVEVFGPNFCLFFFLNMLPGETFNIYWSFARAKIFLFFLGGFNYAFYFIFL